MVISILIHAKKELAAIFVDARLLGPLFVLENVVVAYWSSVRSPWYIRNRGKVLFFIKI
jgi:hypothetical protein